MNEHYKANSSTFQYDYEGSKASGKAAAKTSSILLSPSPLSEFTSKKVDECCDICGAGLVRKGQNNN